MQSSPPLNQKRLRRTAYNSSVMIGNDHKEAVLSNSAIAGGLSGAFTRLVLQPLDVIKTRFQLQVEPISRANETSKYRSIPQAVKTICQEETIFALWKGHVSAQILSVLFGVVQFTIYEELIKLNDHTKHNTAENALLKFYSGGIASSTATIVSFPFDMVRTRFVAQGQKKVYNTLFEAFQKIITQEGFKALYKGLTPTLIQAAPFGGFQFGYYYIFTKIFEKFDMYGSKENGGNSVSNSLTSGFLAGMCAKATTYPLDLCRKRLQIQGFHESRKHFGKPFICSGLVDCFIQIYREESFKGFFKGLQPSLIKSSVTSSMYFAVYQAIMEFLIAIR